MSTNSPNKIIDDVIKKAYSLSKEHDFLEASKCYYKAAEYIKKYLNDDLLSKKYLYLYHIEKLKFSRCDGIHEINSIIRILHEITILEDDRYKERLKPVINFFFILKYCSEKRENELEVELNKLRKETEEGVMNQSQIINHLMCESIYVKNLLETCKKKLTRMKY